MNPILEPNECRVDFARAGDGDHRTTCNCGHRISTTGVVAKRIGLRGVAGLGRQPLLVSLGSDHAAAFHSSSNSPRSLVIAYACL